MLKSGRVVLSRRARATIELALVLAAGYIALTYRPIPFPAPPPPQATEAR